MFNASPAYFALLGLCLAAMAWGGYCWYVQLTQGLGAAGYAPPVFWGAYITTFVFWIGIGHAGTLISLYCSFSDRSGELEFIAHQKPWPFLPLWLPVCFPRSMLVALGTLIGYSHIPTNVSYGITLNPHLCGMFLLYLPTLAYHQYSSTSVWYRILLLFEIEPVVLFTKFMMFCHLVGVVQIDNGVTTWLRTDFLLPSQHHWSYLYTLSSLGTLLWHKPWDGTQHCSHPTLSQEPSFQVVRWLLPWCCHWASYSNGLWARWQTITDKHDKYEKQAYISVWHLEQLAKMCLLTGGIWPMLTGLSTTLLGTQTTLTSGGSSITESLVSTIGYSLWWSFVTVCTRFGGSCYGEEITPSYLLSQSSSTSTVWKTQHHCQCLGSPIWSCCLDSHTQLGRNGDYDLEFRMVWLVPSVYQNNAISCHCWNERTGQTAIKIWWRRQHELLYSTKIQHKMEL